MDLAYELSGAWAQKHKRLSDDLAQAKKYPAFFKKEFVESLEADIAKAEKQYRFWAIQ